MKSMLGNKPKLLKAVLYKLIAKPFFAMFTWTGKAGRGQARKTSLQNYTNILRVLHKILVKLEGSYDFEMFIDHLKNKVIRNAYT